MNIILYGIKIGLAVVAFFGTFVVGMVLLVLLGAAIGTLVDRL